MNNRRSFIINRDWQPPAAIAGNIFTGMESRNLKSALNNVAVLTWQIWPVTMSSGITCKQILHYLIKFVNLNNGGVSPRQSSGRCNEALLWTSVNEGPSYFMWRVVDP